MFAFRQRVEKANSIAEKQYQELDEVCGLSKTELNKKSDNSDLVYHNFDFNKFNIGDEEFNELLDGTKYKHFEKFFTKINELRKAKSRAEDTNNNNKKKGIAKDAASELLNQQMKELDNEYNKLLNAEKSVSL